jgi:septal ring factor EnvC (AmiA/AmiB activator)
MEGTQIRERFVRWVEETRELFTLLPELVVHDQKLSEKSDHAERETERLRHELTELRKELAEAKDQAVEARKGHEALAQELDEARRQNEQLRAEKDEAGQALAKVLETVQATNQIAQKLGVTRSPFARREAPAPAPATPQPAPHE